MRYTAAMRQVRAILFDTFGTLVDWRASLIDELTAFGFARGIEADWPALVDAWRGAYRPSMDRVRTGAQAWTNLDALHRASLDALVQQFGITGLSEPDLRHINFGWHRLRPWADVVPGLTRLRVRYILAPLSNGNVSLLVDLARFGGLPWDMVCGADLFGHYKPDPQTYQGACHLLSLEPEQVLFCAAHNDDLAAAQGHGMHTAFIPRPGEYGPAQTRDLTPAGRWDLVAPGLDALADQLSL